jgi:pimeloyl-ACP methyl ester carboxylesterase
MIRRIAALAILGITSDLVAAQNQVLESTTSAITSIDQRGTGRSRPNLQTPVRYDLPLDRPGSMEEWLPRMRQANRTVAEAFRARGIRLEAYNTRESADDVADQDEPRGAVLGNAINFPTMFLAQAWSPVTDLGEDFRKPIHSTAPTLILVGDLDPRTPVVNAREIAATLPSATVVVLENATHQFDVFGSPVILDVLGRFLRREPVTSKITLPPIVFSK